MTLYSKKHPGKDMRFCEEHGALAKIAVLRMGFLVVDTEPPDQVE